MSNTEIVKKVTSIATCDEKDLLQVLSEALEKVLYFEKLSSKLAQAEGVTKFYTYEYQLLLNQYRTNTKKLGELGEKKFMEITGGMTYAELDFEIDKRLGPATFWGNLLVSFMSGSSAGAYGGKKIRLQSSKNMTKFLTSYAKEAEEIKKELDKAAKEMENSAAMLIPPDYRYPLAIETMLKLVRNLKATTWKECSNLYDEQLYRWKMLENSEKNMRIQREIRGLTKRAADGATAAAVFSGLNFLLK